MLQKHSSVFLLMMSLTLAACGGDTSDAVADEDATRDLSLAPAESVAVMSDEPAADQAQQPAAQPARAPARPQPATPAPAPQLVSLVAAEGTTIMLMAGDTLTSRHNEKGQQIVATNFEPVLDAEGRVVIPPAAVFLGTISDIAPAERPGGEGRLVLTFNRVEFGGNTFEIQARTDSVGAFMKGRGVTAGDAAKVGAGAVAGAIAGRVIGGNRTGTAVGAVAGAAAGVGIAAATRDIDIVLPEGAPIRIVLTAPFEVQITAER
ncbi:MAG TPA: hypothetical protein VGA37_04735 [Gemmatimonadales bacterium]